MTKITKHELIGYSLMTVFLATAVVDGITSRIKKHHEAQFRKAIPQVNLIDSAYKTTINLEDTIFYQKLNSLDKAHYRTIDSLGSIHHHKIDSLDKVYHTQIDSLKKVYDNNLENKVGGK